MVFLLLLANKKQKPSLLFSLLTTLIGIVFIFKIFCRFRFSQAFVTNPIPAAGERVTTKRNPKTKQLSKSNFKPIGNFFSSNSANTKRINATRLMYISSSHIRGSNTRSRPRQYTSSSLASSSATSMMEEFSILVSKEREKPIKLKHSSNGFGGGGGASITIIENQEDSREKYFVKKTGLHGFDMLFAEYKGIKEIFETNTVKTPKPFGVSTKDSTAFVIFEYLNLGGNKDDEASSRLGTQLAQMHKSMSSNGKFGWDINNTCGATVQINTWTDSWSEFFVEFRLRHILKLCHRDGASFYNENEVLTRIRLILEEHENSNNVAASLVHGDLWSGNSAVTSDGDPVIFDPAVYYGDRETDLAMTELFGRLPSSFYSAYEDEFPLPEGYQNRKTIYNLYHILNHVVLFGGGYSSQAQQMMDQIMKM